MLAFHFAPSEFITDKQAVPVNKRIMVWLFLASERSWRLYFDFQ